MQRFGAVAVLTAAAFVTTLASAAFAQSVQANVRGQVVALDGSELTVKTKDATVKVTMADNFRVFSVVKSDLSKIGPGTWIGTAAVPQADGTYRALEIQLFDQANHPNESDAPYDLAPASTMTNAAITTMTVATVGTVEGRMIVFKLKDGDKKVFVPLSAPVVAFEPGAKTAIVPGANVTVLARRSPDGAYAGGAIAVGKDGIIPPF